MALQPDGKIIAGGSSFTGSDNGSDRDFALVRYNADGSLDTSFGGVGKVTTAVGSVYGGASDLALQPDGRIIAVGSSGDSTVQFALVRYNPDGSLDTSFSGDGLVTTAVDSGGDFAYGVVLQPDGRIVAVGSSETAFALVRYNPDGSLDTSFGGDGIVTTSVGDNASAYDVALQPDGKIVAVGWSSVESGVALVRYNSDGSLDASFGGDGIVTAGSDNAIALDVAVQPDGKIVVVGYRYNGSSREFVLIRYRPDGSLDPGFGSDGLVTREELTIGQSVRIQPDGKIIAVGISEISGNHDIALSRWSPDGSLDASFGDDGIVRTALGSFDEDGLNLAIQPDGKIVGVGYSSNGSDFDFAVVRYFGSICGDGVLQPREQCDDGNLAGGDGCSPACLFETCGQAPVTWCRGQSVPNAGLLSLRDEITDVKDELAWKWAKGSATALGDLGDPTGASDYLLCLYQSTSPRLLLSAAMPAGGTCDGRPCWRASSSGFKYKDRALTPDGISQVLLKSGSAGRAKISVKGKGADLQLPAPPFTSLPLTIQLERLDSTVCWEATYSAPSVNASGKFKAKAD